MINFDNPRKSHRCNPINPTFMTDISDAYESAYTIMLNLNRNIWIQKQGDFFVESPIILLAAIIWYLKIFKDGKYCTSSHAIEFLNRRYADIFPILTSYPQLETTFRHLWMRAWCARPTSRPNCERKNPAFPYDFAAIVLGNDGRRFYIGHQQPQNRRYFVLAIILTVRIFIPPPWAYTIQEL